MEEAACELVLILALAQLVPDEVVGHVVVLAVEEVYHGHVDAEWPAVMSKPVGAVLKPSIEREDRGAAAQLSKSLVG